MNNDIFLPWEIIDEILLINNDQETLIAFNRYHTLLKTKNLYIIDILRTKKLDLIRYYFTKTRLRSNYKEILKNICVYTIFDEPLFSCLMSIDNNILKNVIINRIIDFDRVDILEKLNKKNYKFDYNNYMYAKNITSLYKSKCIEFLNTKLNLI